MKPVCISTVLLALIAFSFAVDTQLSTNGQNKESETKMATLHQLTIDAERDNTRMKRLITNFEDIMKSNFFDENNSTDSANTNVESRGKKEEKLLQSLATGLMMAKSFFSIVFMFINQLFQLKNFGFQLLNSIINVGRFILQYQQHISQQQKNQVVKLQASDLGYGTTDYAYNSASGLGYSYYQPTAFSSQHTGSAAERFAKFASSTSNNAHNANLNLHANNLAYAAYLPAAAQATGNTART